MALSDYYEQIKQMGRKETSEAGEDLFAGDVAKQLYFC